MSLQEWNAKSFVWKTLYYHAGHVNMITQTRPAVYLKKQEEASHLLTGRMRSKFR